MADDLPVAEVDEQADVVPRCPDAYAGQVAAYLGARRPAAEAARDDVRHVGLVDRPGVHLEPLPAVCAGQAVLPHDAADAGRASPRRRQTGRRLTVTPDLLGDALILRDPFRPLLAACAAAAAVAPDIKVLEGRVVSGDQFVSPAEQKERILATFGDLCCEMEGCTIAQAAYLNGVPLVVVRAISDKPCAEGQVVDYNTFEKKAACDCARIAARMVKL